MKRLLVLAATATIGLVGIVTATGTAQAASTAQVSVVHGIPKTPVNVFVNGKITIPGFEPGQVAGPLSLPAGTYKVTVFDVKNVKGSGTPILSASATVAA